MSITKEQVLAWRAFTLDPAASPNLTDAEARDQMRALCDLALAPLKPTAEGWRDAPKIKFGHWEHNYGPSGKRENGYSQHTVVYGANVFNFEGPDDAVLDMVRAVQFCAALTATPAEEGRGKQ